MVFYPPEALFRVAGPTPPLLIGSGSGAMSSSEQEEVHLGIFNEEEDGGAMDVEILGSSDHDDGEQDQLVDEAIQNQEGTP